jgi:hypothetical protein
MLQILVAPKAFCIMKRRSQELDMTFQLCFNRQNAKSKVGTYMSIPMIILASTWPKYDITHKHIHILGYL